MSREHARSIWQAAVDAVRPEPLVVKSLNGIASVKSAPRILVVGAGKAGAGMAVGLECALSDRLDRVTGLINVPEGLSASLQRVRLHPARPQGANEPTVDGVAGAEEMLRLFASAGPDDVAVCLLSGGGSALLPAPADGISLADKLAVSRLLHRSGATINEMNCVRKHLSRVKGGRLAEAFSGKFLLSLIISDVVGDPLDVIASGPTSPDPTSFADALGVLDRYRLNSAVPRAVLHLLEEGRSGKKPETLKKLPDHVVNMIIGSNRLALDAAKQRAESLGYRVLDLGSFVEGETREVAIAMAGVVQSILHDARPLAPPACILIGGETTVTLDDRPGKGGRNQEFVLTLLSKLGRVGIERVTALSGGTDGEDGPTDAAGGIVDRETVAKIDQLGLSISDSLRRHDSFHVLERVDGLLHSGFTGTNVMDVRVILVS